MVLFGLSSSVGVSLMNFFAPKAPHYHAHFRSKNFVGKKNAQIQGKSAVHPIGLTSILTQYMGIFLRQNRVRMCALWLSNGRPNTVRFRSSLFPCGIAFINHRRQPDGRFHAFPRIKMNGRNSSTLKIGKFFVFEVLSRRYTGVFQVAKR